MDRLPVHQRPLWQSFIVSVLLTVIKVYAARALIAHQTHLFQTVLLAVQPLIDLSQMVPLPDHRFVVIHRVPYQMVNYKMADLPDRLLLGTAQCFSIIHANGTVYFM